MGAHQERAHVQRRCAPELSHRHGRQYGACRIRGLGTRGLEKRVVAWVCGTWHLVVESECHFSVSPCARLADMAFTEPLSCWLFEFSNVCQMSARVSLCLLIYGTLCP